MNLHEPTLDQIGISEGTDKTSLSGDYLRHYNRVFHERRNKTFNMVEIGVLHGASTRTWKRYFPNATVVGVDIDPSCQRHAEDRIVIEVGSQTDPEFLHYIACRYKPEIIIDDGSHRSSDLIFTFERLFPTLCPGGIYIIEDLHFHLVPEEAERLRGGSLIIAHDYVADLIRDRLGSESYLARLPGLKGHILRSIDRIEAIGQAVIFYKNVKPADRLDALVGIHEYVEASSNWLVWLNYAQRLLAAGAESGVILSALKNSVALNPKSVVSFDRLAEAYERAGDKGNAIATYEAALVNAVLSPTIEDATREKIRRLRVD